MCAVEADDKVALAVAIDITDDIGIAVGLAEIGDDVGGGPLRAAIGQPVENEQVATNIAGQIIEAPVTIELIIAIVAVDIGASTSELKKDPLAVDIPAYPWASLMPPSIESEVLDNRTKLRTYMYDIMIVWKAANIDDATTVEEALEAILSKFDNDPTLSGTAMGGVLPVSMAPQPFQHAGRDLIMGTVQIQAKQHVDMTFT